jgi:hypothetical protein
MRVLPLFAAAFLVGCSDAGTEPEPTRGVFLLTDAREYQLPPSSAPPMSIFVTVSNQTFAGVPVRRCMPSGSAVDPLGADLVFEAAQSSGAWQAVDLGISCLTSSMPRADVVLAPYEVALVARIVITLPGQYRVRLGYGTMGETPPPDTVTSPVFTVR